MSFDDDVEPPDGEALPGQSLDELMSRLADGRGDDRVMLGELYDAIAPRLLDYLRERGITAGRRDELARIAVHEVYRARNSYVDGADVLVWAFAFARQLALAESPAELSLSTEATNLALRGLHAKQIARIFGVSVAQIRELVAGSQDQMKRSLAVDEPLVDEDPMEIAVPGYRLRKLIDTGGMGYVFEAEHIALGTTFAIKVMKEHPRGDPVPVKRFLNEARVMLEIRHPNIVEVYTADRLADGRAWYAMEFLEGDTLEVMLAKGRLAWSQVAKIVRQVCAGLAHVHAQGLVHCDIKPANCFVVGDDLEQPDIRLLDFGVAQLLRTDGHDRIDGREIHGTPAYMAPELFRHRRADARTDIYAIGVMMFEMLTGRMPFEGVTVEALAVAKQLAAPPRLSGRAGLAFSRGIERVIQRALAADPAERFQSVQELDAAIVALDDSGRGRLPFSRWRRDSTRVTLLAASLSALVASVGTAVIIALSSEASTATVPTLGPAEFERGIESVRVELDECRADYPGVAAPTGAKLKVLGGTGRPMDAKLVGPGADDDIAACMKEALKDIRFPRFAAPQLEIEGEL